MDVTNSIKFSNYMLSKTIVVVEWATTCYQGVLGTIYKITIRALNCFHKGACALKSYVYGKCRGRNIFKKETAQSSKRKCDSQIQLFARPAETIIFYGLYMAGDYEILDDAINMHSLLDKS